MESQHQQIKVFKNPKVKILYITHAVPCGTHEAYVIQELLKAEDFFEVIIIPIRPRGLPQYSDAKKLLKNSIIMPLVNFTILTRSLIYFVNNPYKILSILGSILRESRSFKILLRNLCVVPKAVYVSKVLKNMDINHIHVHRASIQTTFALVISKILGIPFSFTAHGYDIYENNMLKKKYSKPLLFALFQRELEIKLLNLPNFMS